MTVDGIQLTAGNKDLVGEILKSPQARRMRWMVTSGFYDRSRIGLWLFEAIGREYDDMAEWAYTIRQEAFVQTCTWSIAIWEWVYGIEPDDALPLDFRRGRVLSKKLQIPPINPARIEEILSALTGVPVTVIENVAPYTFRAELDESGLPAINLNRMFRLLRQIKPSHLSFEIKSRIIAECTVLDFGAGAKAEVYREFFYEETEIITETADYNAGAETSVIREYIMEPPISDTAADFDGGATHKMVTKEDYSG